MLKKGLFIIVFMIVSLNILFAQNHVKIIKITGDVKVRLGLDETWQNAKVHMLLREIDSILTGENSKVVIELANGRLFTLNNNAILDIGDLRKITEKELFLYLMSKKIRNIEPRNEKTKLQIGNVSVIHGESKNKSNIDPLNNEIFNWWYKEKNGAIALFNQDYYPNAIVRLNKILDKYPQIADCGEIHFYLGKSFEKINKNGQAVDAYNIMIDRCHEQDCEDTFAKKRIDEAQLAIERLKVKN